MRLDKYLKISRIIKRRTVANEACDAGRVLVNSKVARASYDVKVGDVNGFGHVLVQIFYLKNDKLYNVNSSDECYSIRSGFKYYKKRFLKRLIRFLNKLEKKG